MRDNSERGSVCASHALGEGLQGGVVQVLPGGGVDVLPFVGVRQLGVFQEPDLLGRHRGVFRGDAVERPAAGHAADLQPRARLEPEQQQVAEVDAFVKGGEGRIDEALGHLAQLLDLLLGIREAGEALVGLDAYQEHAAVGA